MSHAAQSERLRHSTRAHIVLFRFALTSLSASVVDNLVFYLVFHATGTIAGAQTVARIVSVFFNYRFVRRSVFFSDHGHHVLLPRYLLLAGANAVVSYAGIRLLTAFTHLAVMPSKILVETLLFFANFLIQRAYVFTRRSHAANLTDARSAGL